MTQPTYPTHRRVRGGIQTRTWSAADGYGPWQFIPDPKCRKCGDTGRVKTDELADPSDPWSDHKTIPCPRGCEETIP